MKLLLRMILRAAEFGNVVTRHDKYCFSNIMKFKFQNLKFLQKFKIQKLKTEV